MSNASRPPGSYEARRDAICEQAALWADKMASRELTASERAALDAWLEESPAHRLEYELTLDLLQSDVLAQALAQTSAIDRGGQREPVWTSIAQAAKDAIEQAGALLLPPRVGAPIACGVALGVAALLFVRTDTTTEPVAPLAAAAYETALGQSQVIDAPDGSTITLNGASALRLAFTASTRSVHLDGGDAIFDVASDPSRPFTAQAEHARVTVVGTEFAISQTGRGTIVEVTEGKVRVAPTVGPVMFLEPGEGARVSFGAIQRWTFELDERQDWRSGWISTTSMPLADLSEVMSRRTGTPIVIAGRAAHVQVAGRFRIDEPEAVLQRIATAFALDYSRSTDGTITVQYQDAP